MAPCILTHHLIPEKESYKRALPRWKFEPDSCKIGDLDRDLDKDLDRDLDKDLDGDLDKDLDRGLGKGLLWFGLRLFN